MLDTSDRNGLFIVPYRLFADTFESEEVNILHWSLWRTGSSSHSTAVGLSRLIETGLQVETQ